MAPQRQRKRKSTTSGSGSSSLGFEAFPTPPRLVPTKPGVSPSRTPIASPSKRSVRITHAQKQALVENLQLEVTERARKLRAQYALQAQNLRARLEMRIHRIPEALRRATLAELVEKHARKEAEAALQKRKAAAEAASPMKGSSSNNRSVTKIFEDQAPRGTKRTSTDVEGAGKENATAPNPRKRSRTGNEQPAAKTTKAAAARTASKKVIASREILSPKSNNSRTFPVSPTKVTAFPSSPQKSNIARPVSPLKPMPSVAVAQTASSLAKTTSQAKGKSAASRAASRQAQTSAATNGRVKRAAAAVDASSGEDAGNRTSNASDQTNTSAGTTIVKRFGGATTSTVRSATAAKKKATGAVKKAVAGFEAKKDTVSSRAKQPEPKSVASTAGSTRGGRSLRKRT